MKDATQTTKLAAGAAVVLLIVFIALIYRSQFAPKTAPEVADDDAAGPRRERLAPGERGERETSALLRWKV